MAGVRQFDTKKVLDDAMNVFWRLGYEATSVQDLTDATGLGRGSLYGAFMNKEGLFLAVLDHYLDRSRKAWSAALEHPQIEDAIRACLYALYDVLTDDAAQPGCLLVLAAESSEERSRPIRRRVVRAFAEEENALYERFRRAEREGQLPDGADPRALAQFFATQSRAIGLTARWSSDPGMLRSIIETSLAVLSAPRHARKASAA